MSLVCHSEHQVEIDAFMNQVNKWCYKKVTIRNETVFRQN